MKKELSLSLGLHLVLFFGVYLWTFYLPSPFGVGDHGNSVYRIDVVGVGESGAQEKKQMIKNRIHAEGSVASHTDSSADLLQLKINDAGTNRLISIEDYMKWVVVHNRAPEYPRLARLRAEQGKTVIRVVVSSEGRLAQKATLESSSGSLLLDKLALETIEGWNFPRFVSHSAQVSFLIPIRFFMD